MRNGFRSRWKQNKNGGLAGVCERLEVRQLLSGSAAWPVIGTDAFTGGQTSLNAVDPVTGVQSQLSVNFQRDTVTLEPQEDQDSMQLSFGLSAADGAPIAGFFGDNPTSPDSYTVTISSDQSQLELTGTFYGYSNSDGAPNAAAIFVDIQWTQTSVSTQNNYSSLTLQAGERTLESNVETEGNATVTASVQWVLLPTDVLGELPRGALPAWSGAPTSGGYWEISGQTQAIPARADISGLIAELSPPALEPAHSDVNVQQEPWANAELVDPATQTNAGSVNFLGGYYAPTLARSLTANASFFLNSGLSGGITGMINGAQTHASASGSGLATNVGAADPFATTPFTIDAEFTAIPDTLNETYYKGVMTTEGSVSTMFQEVTSYDAIAQGTLTVGTDPPLSITDGAHGE